MSPSPDNHGAPDGAKRRVLVVDDEPTLRLGFAYALSSKTTEVDTAATGQLALEMISETRFDIIILDLRMPDLDGIGVIDSLRREGNNVPIVLCSAALNPNAASQAILHGVVDFLLKPVRPVDLRQMVDFVLHPGQQPFPQAMKAARQRQTDEAILMIGKNDPLDNQAACWLKVLRSIQEAYSNGDHSNLEELIRTNLPTLAFKGV